MTTFEPREIPENKVTIKEITELLLPTAAKASLLAKRPTTAVPTELKSCCKILQAARGMANNKILSNKLP